MIFKRFKLMLVALFLFSLTILFMGPLTQAVVNYFWLKPGVVQTIGLIYGSDANQGLLLQKKALSSEDILPVFGSSELGSGFDFNATKVFAGKPTGFTPFMIGRGYYQCLTFLMDFAGQDNLQNKKLVMFLLIDWFSPQGLSSSNLEQNFSPLHVYQLLFNASLPDQLKQLIVERILQFPQVLENYPVLNNFLRTYDHSGWRSLIKRWIYWPVARIDLASLQMQDAVNTIKIIRKLDPKIIAKNSVVTPSSGSLPWSELREQAEKQGKAKIRNEYGVLDSSYSEWVKDKGSMKNAKLYPSLEYNDLELLLKVLQVKGAKPLFVITPANGPWYDFKEFPISERQKYYQRLREIIGQYGFEVADLSPHEYELYYMQDPWHIGWKGWVDVDEIMDNFYHAK